MQSIQKALFFIMLICGASLWATTWESPLTVDTGTASHLPKIVSDDQGNAAVAWVQIVSGDSLVHVSYRALGGGWETPTIYALKPVNAVTGINFDICMDRAGNITLIWAANDGTDITIEEVFRPAGAGSFPTTSTTIQTAPGGVITGYADTRVDCVSQSTQAVIGFRTTGPTPLIQGMNRVGTTWITTAQRVNSVTETIDTSSKPIPQILPNGKSYMAFRATDGVGTDIFVSGRNPGLAAGTTWDSPGSTAVNFLGTIGTPESFDFDMNESGQGIIATEIGGTIAAVFYQSSAAATPQVVTTTTSKAVGAGIDNNGQASLIWQTDVGGNIQLGTRNITGPSWAISTISSGSSNTMPVIDVSENGGIVVGWTDSAAVFQAKVGFSGSIESASTPLDTQTVPGTVNISNGGIAFASWLESVAPNRVEASRTLIDASNLIQALGNKRLVYQKGLYP